MTFRPGTSSIDSPSAGSETGVFESLAHDLSAVLRIQEGRKERQTTAIEGYRTQQEIADLVTDCGAIVSICISSDRRQKV
jgi:hypothetical protein